MARFVLVLAVLAAATLPAQAVEQQLSMHQNPVRKVVNLLQALEKKVVEEGAKEKELYDKFMCYCTTGKDQLAESIKDAEAKAPALAAEIEATQGKLTQTKADLAQAQADREAGKQAAAEATALREKEAAAFASEKAEYDTNIAAITKAVEALEKGSAASFLQSPAAKTLRDVASSGADMSDRDRQMLVSFLSSAYAPQSGAIIGILKQLGDELATNLADATASEAAAVKSFEELIAAKKKEEDVLTAAIEAKTSQVGELGVLLVQKQDDYKDTVGTLEEDKKFIAELETTCVTKQKEWEERSKTRQEELVAIADTIKTLNDDDALELFKKTLPSEGVSLLQLQVGAAAVRRRALAVIRAAHKRARGKERPALEFIALALAGKKALSAGGFEKVLTMIDAMVDVLKKEQQDDDSKKDYCTKELDVTEDKKKVQDQAVADIEKAIATALEGVKTLTAEIAALGDGIKALDASVADATVQRQQENAEYKDLLTSNTAAKELLVVAKNRLNKFYNPKLYKAPPANTTGAASFVQIRMHAQSDDEEAPAPPPETWGAYQKKSEEGSSVISLIDLLIKDLDKEITEAEVDEKDAQADYETMMAESSNKRTSDAQSLTQKEGQKADIEAEIEAHKVTKGNTFKDLMATVEYLQALHKECDWLLQNYDLRKSARVGETDALQKAKAVLSGADYALLQTRVRSHLRRPAQQ